MRWFRYYSEAAQDGKVQHLSAQMFRYWVNILALANEGKPRGRLPVVSDIAFWLHVSTERAQKIVAELQQHGLLDELEGRLVPHNWDERQPIWDDAGERQRRYRSRDTATSPSRDSHVLDKKREDKTRGEESRREEGGNIFRLYEQTIGPFDPHMATKLQEAEGEYSWECIQHSFAEASELNKRSWRYVEAILKAHKANGCYTGRRDDTGGNNLDHDELHRRYELAGKHCPICYVPEDEPEEAVESA